MIEIERKFRLTRGQAANIYEILKSDSSGSEPVRQVDKIFLKGIRSFRDFKPGMPVIRLRSINDKSYLTYKRSINASGDAIEHELRIDSPETMQKIIEEMGYSLVTCVDKERLESRRDNLTIALDDVSGLGNFLEIEVMTDESDQGETEALIFETAAEFGLGRHDIEAKKYDQLVDALST